MAFQIITARTDPNRDDAWDLQGPCNIRITTINWRRYRPTGWTQIDIVRPTD